MHADRVIAPLTVPVPPRCCILILGMHRSGTSALTSLLGLLGAAGPRETMPATEDNPQGYGESPRIARLNNRLLESAGTRWNEADAIPDGWFASPAREADRAEAAKLLREEFPAPGTFVLKDPRICRLLPFWRPVLEAAGIAAHALLMLRDPLEVARSLATRAADPRFSPAAIVAQEKALLLWLRHVIDAEQHSRGLPRHAIKYEGLLTDWREGVAPLFTAGVLPPPTAAAEHAAAACIDPSLRRQRLPLSLGSAAAPPPAGAQAGAKLLAACGAAPQLPAHEMAAAVCDALAGPLDQLVADLRPLRAGDGALATQDPYATAILEVLDAIPEPSPGPPRRGRVFFISGSPTSVGHVYRVEHTIAALLASGWQASWLPSGEPETAARAEAADVVVVFRAAWNDALAAIAARCRKRGVPLVYDVDDLIFEPRLMADGSIAVLAAMPDHDRQVFMAAAANHRTMLTRATTAILSTRPLAEAAAVHCPTTFVLPNALDPRMETAAAAARDTVRKPAAADGRPRLVFASGTPSHDRDFTVAAEAIARLFARHPEPCLVLLGHIDPASHPCLEPFADRIEIRPVVPLPELFSEIARCDVNLAPLELDNPFCAAKSAVRCLVASMVEVPSVVSPTPPLQEAVVDGRTGLVAGDVATWERALEQLITDNAGRLRMGHEAKTYTAARWGFAAWRLLVDQVFTRIAGDGTLRCHAATGAGRISESNHP